MKTIGLVAFWLLLGTQVASTQVDGGWERIADVRICHSGNRVELILGEARDVRKIILQFPAGEKLPRPSSVRVLYWYDLVLNGEWGGEWRYANAIVVETTDRAPANPDLRQVLMKDLGSTGGSTSTSTSKSQSKPSGASRTETKPAEKRPGPFSEVPSGHWAYEAVRNLVRRGIMVGYPSGTFGGKALMTRFEFAQAVARVAPMLRDAVQRKSSSDAPKFEKADLEILKRLMAEFHEEIIAIGVDADAIKRDMAELARSLTPRIAEGGGGLKVGRALPLYVAPVERTNPTVSWTITLQSMGSGNTDAYGSTQRIRLIFPKSVPRINSVEVLAAE